MVEDVVVVAAVVEEVAEVEITTAEDAEPEVEMIQMMTSRLLDNSQDVVAVAVVEDVAEEEETTMIDAVDVVDVAVERDLKLPKWLQNSQQLPAKLSELYLSKATCSM